MTTPFLLDRRSLLVGAAAAGAAGAAASLSTPAAAAAPKQGVHRPGLYRFTVGEFEVTTILDGAIVPGAPHPIFGENVDAADVAELAGANFLPADAMEIGFTVTLVNTGSELILFDTGNGAQRRPNAGALLATLGEIGIEPGQIDRVVITHCHGDHIGGLMEAGRPAFPNASYAIGEVEYDYWSSMDLLMDDSMAGRAQLVQDNVVPFAEKMTFLKGGDTVAPGIEAVASHGHTPGHMCYHLESNGQRLLIAGDVSNHYVFSLQRPDWHVRFDMDKEAAVAARKEIFGMVAADRIPFVGYHMPAPSVGYVEPLGDGFRYVAASYQLHI